MKHSDFAALDDDEVAACPECGSSKVRLYSPGGYADHDGTARYGCRRCEARFDAYDVRARRQPSAGPSGLAARLAAADPDEVSR